MTRAPRIDLAELAAEEDPYAVYGRLRAGGPVWRAGPNQWLVTRYAEVAALLHDPRLLQFQLEAVGHRGVDPAVEFTRRILPGRDGADHRELRRCMVGVLRPFLERVDELVHAEVESFLADIRAKREFDAVSDFAFRLPINVLGTVLGIPKELRNSAGLHCLALARVFSPAFVGPERDSVNTAVVWLRACIGDLLTSTNGTLEGFVHALARSAGNAWPREDVIDNVIVLLFAGFETSLNLLSSGLDVLTEHPKVQDHLRRDPSLLADAVEEILRYESPVHATGRVTAEPIELAGQRISKGRVILLLLASANRDERVFESSEQFIVTRARNRHLAFGAGHHYCLGASIARRESSIAFGRLLAAFGTIERCGVRRRARSATIRSLERLDISVSDPT